MDYSKIYEGMPKRPENQSNAEPFPDNAPELNLNEATPVLAAKLVRLANHPNADARDIKDALDILYKLKYIEANKDKLHDIRIIMSLLTSEQLDKLKEMSK